ncbi:hypothetical protein BZG36_04119 [Bifiguratus adelaidae]|uniref:Uncharacterized protein n=1 Tax=Bifiguratus adelaidae TaxID=1938954 RepID=A0A261XX13_9FUNG|nr:hypothetical protein BZG36_04119 [Bifiguratus adelaidae]
MTLSILKTIAQSNAMSKVLQECVAIVEQLAIFDQVVPWENAGKKAARRPVVFNGAQIGTNYKNYSISELLVDANDNTTILQRATQAVITPTTPEETSPNV